MRSIVCLILAFSPLYLSTALAQEACVIQAPVEHRLKLELNEKPGWWFSQAHTTLMLGDLLELDSLRLQIDLMGRRISFADQQQAELRTALGASEEAQKKSSDIIETAERRARIAEENESGLFGGKPYVWALGGTLLGVVTTMAIALLVP